MFLKAPVAPIYTYFEGGARVKKVRFFSQHFPKIYLRRRMLSTWGLYSDLGELRKSIWSS